MKIKRKLTYGNPNDPDLKLSDRLDLTVADRAARSDTVRSGLIHVKSKQTDALATQT